MDRRQDEPHRAESAIGVPIRGDLLGSPVHGRMRVPRGSAVRWMLGLSRQRLPDAREMGLRIRHPGRCPGSGVGSGLRCALSFPPLSHPHAGLGGERAGLGTRDQRPQVAQRRSADAVGAEPSGQLIEDILRNG